MEVRSDEQTFDELVDIFWKNSQEHGFHDDDASKSEAEIIATWMMNLHAEISELWEAYRVGKLHQPCDKAERLEGMGLPILTCLEEELADVVIRACDDAKALGVDLGRAVAVKHEYNKTRPYKHGKKC